MISGSDYDVVVIGGGPGGSTAAAFLAREGKRVLLLEKESFPRFRIGESLLPFAHEVMEASGVLPKIAQAGFIPKHGAEFCTGNSNRFNRIWFANGLVPGCSQTFQVERSRFDEILLGHAGECGCEVRERSCVQSVDFQSDPVAVEFRQSEDVHKVTCRWVIDASGRDTFLGRHLGIGRFDLGLPRRMATYAHFKGVYRNPGNAAGLITIIRLQSGWVWIIPLDDEKTSVGLVQTLEDFKRTGGAAEDVFNEVVSHNSEVAGRMKDALRVNEYRSTSDYTYRYRELAGPRWLMAGDAGGFIDPIFSSGVMIAMKSAWLAADRILDADRRKSSLSPRNCSDYTRRMFAMMDVYLRMIHIFYDDRGFEVFVNPVRSRFGVTRAVTSLLAGFTRSHAGVWWRVRMFYMICWLQRWLRLVPRIDYAEKNPSRNDRLEAQRAG